MKHSLKLSCASLALAALAFGAHAQEAGAIDFGDDSGLWANDGECDDPRFEGGNMSDVLDDADIKADASDCKAAFLAGAITFTGPAPSAGTQRATPDASPLVNAMPGGGAIKRPAASGDIDYGDDEGFFSNDGECDDARFIGDGMAEPPLLPGDIGHDATDCAAGMASGSLRLRTDGDPSIEEVTEEVELTAEDQALLDELAALIAETEERPIDPARFDEPPADGIMFNGVNFGDNASEWSNDGECDDPRFKGQGQTGTTLLETDAYHDANDCLDAWKAGGLELVEF